MRLLSCLHPKIVKNPYTGEVITCRCGKCEACLNARSANWVQRLNQEQQDNKYTVFVTLQYDDLHVPQMVRLNDVDSDGYPSYIDSMTGEIISLKEVRPTKKDFVYCYNTKVLLVHNNIDFPKFIKRLRYYLHELTKDTTGPGNLRYFATAEYGETTFRPHYHCLLFFNSSLFAQNFEKLLDKAWKFGNVYQPHIVSGQNASSYVASYVNSFTSLPKIYLCKSIRQRSFFSKSPAIGTLTFGLETVKRIFDSATPEFRLFNQTTNKFIDVPLWRSLRDRCFPRIQRFDSLTHGDRVSLYRLCETSKMFITGKSAKEIAQWLYYYHVRRRERKDFVSQYLQQICFIPTHVRGHYFRRFSLDSLIHFVRVLLRVQAQAASYGITIHDYVKQIEKFYENCQKSQLTSYYAAQDDYFKKHDKREYLLMQYQFYKEVNGTPVDCLLPFQRYYLEYYGLIDASTTGVVNLSLNDCFEYVDLKHTHEKIFWDNTKTKSKNDYLFAHSDKFQNIINYKKQIEQNE